MAEVVVPRHTAQAVLAWVKEQYPDMADQVWLHPGEHEDLRPGTWVISMEGAGAWAVRHSYEVTQRFDVFAEPLAGWCLALYAND